jgi:phosphoheptose isomerase
MNIDNWELSKQIEQFSTKKVLVVGDLMLDKYVHGDVSRISPEAPIPIIKTNSTKYVLGGASNAANNIASVGANVIVAGFVGEDWAAKTFLKLMKEKNIDTSGVMVTKDKPTIEKTRFVAKTQQLLRSDAEISEDVTDAQARKLFSFIRKTVPKVDVVVISDYAKGTITEKLCKSIIKLCNDLKKKVIVDTRPKHKNYYKNAYLITPNFKEAKELLGLSGEDTDEFVVQLGNRLMRELNTNVIITRGPKGMAVFEKGKDVKMMPTKALDVFDVSGAGDTVVAILSLALASDMTLEESAKIGNHAGGIVVGKMGTATLTPDELKSFLREDITKYLRDKIRVTEKVIENQLGDIEAVVKEIIRVYSNENKVMVFGNGGSASDAQHLAGELVGRFKIERKGLPAIALTTDTSIITSVANDYSYDVVFSRQLEALGNPGDVAIGITTSGNSKNVIEAFKKGKELGMTNILFTGKDGGKAKDLADISIIVPTDDTPLIQETHISLVHIMCDLLDRALYANQN